MVPQEIDHGTANGYAAHQRRGEEPCEQCRLGKAEYDRDRRSWPGMAEKARLRSRARYLAIKHLIDTYRKEYQKAYVDNLVGLEDLPRRRAVTRAQSRARVHMSRSHANEYHELYEHYLP